MICTCNYCGFQWELVRKDKMPVCGTCLDSKNIVINENDSLKLDTYVGCPPFPPKELSIEKDEEDPFDVWGFSD